MRIPKECMATYAAISHGMVAKRKLRVKFFDMTLFFLSSLKVINSKLTNCSRKANEKRKYNLN